jgi:hypothetical protein
MRRDDSSLHVEKLGAGTRDLIKHDTRLGTLFLHVKGLTNGPMLYPVDQVHCFGQMEVMSIGCLITTLLVVYKHQYEETFIQGMEWKTAEICTTTQHGIIVEGDLRWNFGLDPPCDLVLCDES